MDGLRKWQSGPRFKPPKPDSLPEYFDILLPEIFKSAGIAQLVERITRNDEVRGSIPRSGTISVKEFFNF